MNNIKNVKLNNKCSSLLKISQNEKSSVKINLANENYSNQERNHRINVSISKVMSIDYVTYREREREREREKSARVRDCQEKTSKNPASRGLDTLGKSNIPPHSHKNNREIKDTPPVIRIIS